MQLSLSTLCGGLPFVSSNFAADRLLAACVARRRMAADHFGFSNPFNLPASWLDPDVAAQLRMHEGYTVDILNAPMSDAKSDMLNQVIATIRQTRPWWTPMLGLPVVVRELRGSMAIACSCYAIPQHIFLGEGCFVSHAELAEQFIHELAHNWMYLIEEIAPLHDIGWATRYTLPSGTGNRNPTEVLGAAHVSATLMRWYTRDDKASIDRRIDLDAYQAGCMEIVGSLPTGVLTPIGADVAAALALSRCNA